MGSNESPHPNPAVPAARAALITGASRGIGREIALGLAQAGVNVALIATDGAKLEMVANEIRQSSVHAAKVIAITADVSNADDVAKAVANVFTEFGQIDLLVNAAGIIDNEVPAWEADIAQWWRVFEVNVKGPFLMTHAIVPQMIARGGGRIVDLSSGAASHSMSTASAYNASKTALLRFGEHLAIAGATQGLKVFEVAPGVVQTDMTAGMEMHRNRTEWTPVAKTVEMVLAIARGELDDCSGWFIRVSDDTPASLRALAARRANESGAGLAAGSPTRVRRKLRVLPASPEDALARALIGH